MSSADAAPHPDGRPSVFLSYASEDRAAVRKLRDALNAAGVDAWYDENELTGGDDWDAKIRRQIRECTYFMPVISSRASARLEGYFRREWRFALERMMDMADDVVFLLPIVIDETQEGSARVPEKFLSVQWMRVPAGDATKSFHDLARRLAAGGPHRLHHAPTTRAAEKNSGPRAPQYLPPPEPEAPAEWWRKPKFYWKQLPRWVRVIAWIFIIIWAVDACSSYGDRKPPDTPPKSRRTTGNTTGTTSNPGVSGTTNPIDIAKASATANDVADRVEQAMRQAGLNAKMNTAEKRPAKRASDLVFMPAQGAANSISSELYGKFVTVSGVRVQLSPLPLKEGETAAARASAVGARLMLNVTETTDAAGKPVFRVALEPSAGGSPLWTADYPTSENPSVITAQVYAQILPLVLKKE